MPQTHSCPYDSGDTSEALVASENMFGMGGQFHYGRCAGCGALVLRDVPTDLGPYYQRGYYSFDAPSSPEPNPFTSALMAVLLRMPAVSRWLSRGRLAGRVFPVSAGWFAGLGVTQRSRILEVGTGGGAILGQLRRLGFEYLVGIDPFLETEERTFQGITIRRRTLAEVEEPADVIIFHHVLEHVADPVAELARARTVLSTGGHILVVLPLADSAAFERYGADWVQLDAPRHLTIPTARGLESGAAAAGLTLVEHWRTGTSLQFWGSEQYRQGIPLNSEQSWHRRPSASPWTKNQVNGWSKEARALNRAGRGDEGAFVFRAAA